MRVDIATWLQMTMNMLAQAQGVCGTTAGQDEDMVDYINVLRESVLEAYSGIVQVRAVYLSIRRCHFRGTIFS